MRGTSWASWCFCASVMCRDRNWFSTLVAVSSLPMPVFYLQISWAALKICRKMLTPANHFLSFPYLWNQDLRLIFIAGLHREERRVWQLGFPPLPFFFFPPYFLFSTPSPFFFPYLFQDSFFSALGYDNHKLCVSLYSQVQWNSP